MTSDFDDRAATWDDDPNKVERSRDVATRIRDVIPLDVGTRLLEYGAGTGLLAQALAADVGPITLAEPSRGMREVMAKKIAEGLLPSEARIWDLDLAADDAPDERFDVIATLLTLHHIQDVPRVLVGFAELLAEGGWLCVIDLEAEDGSFHEHRPGFDGHDGFEREDLTEQLAAAGFIDIRFADGGDVPRDDRDYPMFLAVCRPPGHGGD